MQATNGSTRDNKIDVLTEARRLLKRLKKNKTKLTAADVYADILENLSGYPSENERAEIEALVWKKWEHEE